MTFNSIEFILFLAIAWLTYQVLGQRYRWIFLLGSSLVFYALLNIPHLLVAIFLVISSTYVFGILIHRSASSMRTTLFVSGVCINVLTLVFLKYIPFLTDTLNALLKITGRSIHTPHLHVFAAIGVSYYIFQAISYLIDIFLDTTKPEKHFGYFALYLAFFPKLLQGPIERAADLLPQLKRPFVFDYANIRFSMLLFGWGLFKKIVLADRLGIYVDSVYSNADSYVGVSYLLATYAYAFQIYFDFSGYTDMAIAAARLFNIQLTNNFNDPYKATSVADFWRRWHISFSRWILDYIFKPLQLSLRSWRQYGTAVSLIITFFVSGLWHGANWNFILWGLLHGFFMALSVIINPVRKRIYKSFPTTRRNILKQWQTFLTFHLICFAWIFFRASNIGDAFNVIRNIADIPACIDAMLALGFHTFISRYVIIVFNKYEFLTLALFIGFCFVSRKLTVADILARPALQRWAFYYALVLGLLVFGLNDNSNFLYLQF